MSHHPDSARIIRSASSRQFWRSERFSVALREPRRPSEPPGRTPRPPEALPVSRAHSQTRGRTPRSVGGAEHTKCIKTSGPFSTHARRRPIRANGARYNRLMRTRLRSTIKWSGTVLTVLLLVVWVGSAWWGFGGLVGRTTIAGIDSGGLFVRYESSNMLAQMVANGEWPTPVWRHRAGVHWWVYWRQYRSSLSGALLRMDAYVPIWTVLLVLSVPTCYLWYRDRRRPPGLCSKCGYDLRGTDHDVCPECGRETPNRAWVGTAALPGVSNAERSAVRRVGGAVQIERTSRVGHGFAGPARSLVPTYAAQTGASRDGLP